MATLTVQQLVRTGLNPALAAAAAGGDVFANNGRTFLRVKNEHADTARTVTVASQLSAVSVPPGTAKADLAVAVPAQAERWIGPLDPAAFNDASGRVVCTYSSEADLTVGAYTL